MRTNASSHTRNWLVLTSPNRIGRNTLLPTRGLPYLPVTPVHSPVLALPLQLQTPTRSLHAIHLWHLRQSEEEPDLETKIQELRQIGFTHEECVNVCVAASMHPSVYPSVRVCVCVCVCVCVRACVPPICCVHPAAIFPYWNAIDLSL